MSGRAIENVRPYPPDYVSAETLAYRLDCSRSTVDQYVKAGLLPQPFVLGNLVRWDFALVKAYIEARGNEAVRGGEQDEFLKAVSDATAKDRKA
jgi:excisionase family DNA binding protein